MKMKVLLGEAPNFRDGAAYYYPSGYTAYYVEIRTMTEDDAHVRWAKKILMETAPTDISSIDRVALWVKGRVLRVEAGHKPRG